MANTLKFGNGEWYGKKDTILAYNDENSNYKPLPFDFSRASSATRVNKAGLIETVSAGMPRIDYKDDSEGALLLEPTRSNLFPYSQYFGVGGLEVTTTGTQTHTITNNYSVSPDGTQNALRFQATVGGSSSDRVILRDALTTTAVDSTLSLYAKSNTTSNLTLVFHYNGGTRDAFIVTPEWKRFTYSDLSNTINNVGIELKGDETSLEADVSLYGFQFENNSYATSYIPTSGSAVTRVAEQGINGGSGVPIFSNTSAVWFIDLERNGVDTDSSGSAIALRNSSFSQQIRLHFDQPATDIRFRDGVNGFATISTITGANPNVRKKLALRIDGSTLSTFSNGSKIGSDYTAPNAFDLEEIDFSSIGFKIHDMRFYNTTLTDQELIALTQV